MKQSIFIGFLIALLTVCAFLSAGCSQKGIVEGPFTPENDNIFKDSVPIEVDDAVIQACFGYIAENGYGGIKDTNGNYTYKSVRLGEEDLPYVYSDDEDMRDMVDENDYLIVFGFVNIVVDSDTI